MVYVPLGGNLRRHALAPPYSWLPPRHSQCKWKASFFLFLRRGWKIPKRDRILGSITQLVLKVGAERPSSDGPFR